MYSVPTGLGDGEFLFVVARERLGEARRLVQGRSANQAREYVIRDSKGNDADPKNYSAALATQVEPDPSPRSFQQAEWRDEFLEKPLD